MSTAGTYEQLYISSTGCDSTHIFEVAVKTDLSIVEEQIICEGESALIFDSYLSEAGTYQQSFTTASGCDSMHTIELRVRPHQEVVEYINACEGETAIVFGEVVSQAGRYSRNYQSITGCDSLHQIEAVSYTHLTLPTNREV